MLVNCIVCLGKPHGFSWAEYKLLFQQSLWC